LTRPDLGMVRIYGEPPENAISAGNVGAMLQSGSLVRYISVRELISMMASLYPHPMPVETVLEIAGLLDIADRRTQKLSGGESQRVRLAIAVVSDPQLLVLDEPTVALDVEARHLFWKTIKRFTSEGRTVMFATHYLDEADAYADRIVLIARGRVVADGPTTEIKARVGTHTIRATLPDASMEELRVLPGVINAWRSGAAVSIRSSDSDRTVRALLDQYPEARDLDVQGAGLEETFLELTSPRERA